jgi:hypothetical protein
VDVSGETAVRCDVCDARLVAGDRFCEECGARVGHEAIEDEHVPEGRLELDLGAAAAVSDQGRLHRRNEDAFHLELVDDAVVAVVCDGISTAASGHVAARTAAQVAGAALTEAVRGGAQDLEAATAGAIAAATSPCPPARWCVRCAAPASWRSGGWATAARTGSPPATRASSRKTTRGPGSRSLRGG